MLPLDLINELSLDLEYIDHKNLSVDETSLFYGFQIKNRYDEKRLLIHESINPIRVYHQDTDKHFYGIQLEGNKTYDNLKKHLFYHMSEKEYRLLFSEFNIETQNSYELFNFGIFPFDKSLDLCKMSFQSQRFFANEEIPFYQRISGLTPYIFVDKN
tara:strand:- start:106 stop:576 length:471 start_codon:yes stop_codon:yes gene_type:complete